MRSYRRRCLLSAVLPLALSLFLLCGCTKPGQTPPPQEVLSETQESAGELFKEGFLSPGSVEEGRELWASEFERLSWEPELKESETLGRSLGAAQTAGGKLYLFFEIDGEDKDGQPDKRWMMECFDAQTGEVSLTPISREDLGLGDGPWQSQERTRRLANAAVIAPGSYVFLYAEDEKTEEGYHVDTLDLIYADLQGSCRRVSMFDTYLENGILEKLYLQNGEYMAEPVSGSSLPPFFHCDGKGNTYSLSGISMIGYTAMSVFDPEGALLLRCEAEDGKTVFDSFLTPDGERIAALYDRGTGCYEFYRMDTEQKEAKKAGEIRGGGEIDGFYGMQGENLYYRTQKSIIRWNVRSGGRERFLSFEENGMRAGSSLQLLGREGEDPLLWMEAGGRAQYLVRLAGEKNSGLPTVRIGNLFVSRGEVVPDPNTMETIRNRAAACSINMPGVIFSYESAKDAESYRDRSLAEMAAGEGPDILYVSREDLIMMQEKGLLADLTELVPEGLWERVYPAVRELGTVNGERVGITPGITASGVAVSRDLWPGDTWTFEDMLLLMEEGKLQPLLGFYNRSWGTYCSPLATRLWIMDYQLEKSFFLDLEKGKCHTQDDLFLRFLKATDVSEDSLENDGQTLLNGGNMMHLVYFDSKWMAEFDTRLSRENGSYVGWPQDGGCGNYIADTGFIAVNKNSPRMEEIRFYLGDLLSDGTLKNQAVPIIRADPEDITADEDGNLWWRKEQLTVFEDGSTSLDRAMDFLQSCVPEPRADSSLLMIMREEMTALRDGGRTPEQTADILGNRIQLYLNENR